MLGKRLKEIISIGMIGKGIVGIMRPQCYLRLWKFGPKPYQEFIE
jgi:hypothetical protein